MFVLFQVGTKCLYMTDIAVNPQSKLLLHDSRIIIIKINTPCPKNQEIIFHLSPVQQNSAALTSSRRAGDRIPMGARFFAPVQTVPGAHPASCTMGTRSFPVVKKSRGVTLIPYSLLVPWSWKGRAILLLPLWAVRPVQSLSACTRVHFTLPYFTYGHYVSPFWLHIFMLLLL